MFRIRRIVTAVAMASVALLPASAQSKLGVLTGNYLTLQYGGIEYLNVTNSLNAAFGGAANVTVLPNATNLSAVMGFDALWIDLRTQTGRITAQEQSVLTQFIASGKRTVFIGENNGWLGWNNSFLSIVGGSAATTNIFNERAVAIDHPLTAGLTGLRTTSAGHAVGGLSLFNENVATLWGTQQNVLTYLDAGMLANAYWRNPINGQPSNEAKFVNNIGAWMVSPTAVVPEPSTYAMMGAGLLAIAVLSRRTRRAS